MRAYSERAFDSKCITFKAARERLSIMRQAFFVLVFIFSLNETSIAANKEAAVDAVVDLILSQQDVNHIENRMRGSFEKYVGSLELRESQMPIIGKYRKSFETLISRAISDDRVRPLMKRLYSEMYTSDELDELLGFYKTPLGGKVIRVTPVIAREVEFASQAYLESDLKPELVDLLDKMQDELDRSLE